MNRGVEVNNNTSTHVTFNGFTLAEVLITLGIIGIVAAMTIPLIINSSDKQRIVSQVKEAYSIASQATALIKNDCGGDVADCLTTPNAAAHDPTTRQELAKLRPNCL